MSVAALCAVAAVVAAGEFEYDSRRAYDLCSPDQVASTGGARITWGRYRQWRTINGEAAGPGALVLAPWNTCVDDPDYTYVTWKGTGDATFSLRAADDGDPPGRNAPGTWSAWRRLEVTGGRLAVPASFDGRQWIQLKAELGANARLTQLEIHKRVVLPAHPRILLTPKRIAHVKERIARDARIAKIHDHYIAALKGRCDGWMRRNTNPWTACRHMVSVGIAWNLSRDAAFLAEAKAQLARLETPFGMKQDHFGRPQVLAGGVALLDLVYNDLARAERARFGRALLLIADQQQAAWRFSDVSNQIYTNSGKNILTGLALAGAGIDAKKEAFYLRQAEDLVRLHLIPATNFWSSDDGGWGEGHGYCDFMMTDWALEAHAWASATGEDVFQCADFFRFLTQWRAYERRYDASQAKFNDSARGSPNVPFSAFAASRWRDRIAQVQAKKSVARAFAKPGDFAVTNLWEAVLWYDPDLPAAAAYSYPATMPLGRHFAGVGHVVCRSGWRPEDVWAVFKSGPAYTPGTHYHADENSFVIDRGGSLAIDAGSDDRSCPHYRCYFTRTIAHNTVTVTKPGEPFRGKGVPNDGGQIGGSWCTRVGDIHDSAQWGMHIRPPLQLDGIVAFETCERYTYAAGDATKAYDDGKMRQFTRQFLHIQPNVIVAFDRVIASDASYRKRWLVHTIAEPEVRGRTVVVTHLRGRLFSQTLLPTDANITKVGGPGAEFLVDGRNYPIKNQKKACEPGAWRVEVSPGAPRQADRFLHVMHVTDASRDAAPVAQVVEGQEAVFATWVDGDRMYAVEFAATGPVAGRVRVTDGDDTFERDLARDVQPQRFDPEDIWE